MVTDRLIALTAPRRPLPASPPMSMLSTLLPPSSASSKRIVFGWELGNQKKVGTSKGHGLHFDRRQIPGLGHMTWQ